MPERFAGRVVLITGAGSGIGRALARAFSAEGARLVLLDVDEAGLAETAASLPGESLSRRCDVRDPGDCEAAVREALARFGGLDVAVANAGISHRSLFVDTEPEVLRRVVEVNFFGAVNTVRAALPAVRERKGLLVATSSVAGFAPLVGRTGYAASKHALHGFMDSLRSELRGTGVEVLVVCPAFADTALARAALDGRGEAVGASRRDTAGGTMSAEQVADAVLDAAARRRRMALISPVARASFWVSRLAPRVYERIMLREQAGEFGGS